MLRLLFSEWLKGRRRPLEKYTSLLAISCGVVIPIIMMLVSSRNAAMRASALGSLAFPSSVGVAGSVLSLLGPLFASAFGANIAGAEYQYGTWPWLLVRSAGRGRLFVSKVLVGGARIVVLALMGSVTFVVMGAVVCLIFGSALRAPASREAQNLLYSFVTLTGLMTFSAAIALLATLASRSIVFGSFIGVTATPLMAALRFKETAPWNFYLHLQNIQSHLMGQPTTMLMRAYEFNMSVEASVWIVTAELTAILVVAFLVFRQQEIVY